MNISLNELKSSFNKIISTLEAQKIQEIEISQDFYWYIQKEDCYNPYHTPKVENLTIGQLSEDIEEIKKIAYSPEQPILYSLVWLSVILRAIGENPEIFDLKKQ